MDPATILGIAAPIVGSGLKYAIENKRADKIRERENKYNSPQEQIKRLKKAGVSPSMFYNGGGLVTADVGTQQTKMDPNIGTAQGIENYQKISTTNIAKQMAVEQLKGLKLANVGRVIQNQYQKQKLSRYNSDMDFWNSLKANKDYRDTRTMKFMETVEQRRVQISQDAQNIQNERWAIEEQFLASKEALNIAKTKQEMRIAKKMLTLDAARLAIQKGQLDINQDDLSIRFKKYEADYAFWQALEKFEDQNGAIDWKSITKSGANTLTPLMLKFIWSLLR